MGPNVDKLFLTVAGAPVVAHTWRQFDRSALIDDIVLVVRDGLQPAFEALAREFGFSKPVPVRGRRCRAARFRLERPSSPRTPNRAGSHSRRRAPLCDRGPAGRHPRRRTPIRRRRGRPARRGHHQRIRGRPSTSRATWSAPASGPCKPRRPFAWKSSARALAAARDRGLSLTDDTAACELIGQPVRLGPSAPPPTPKSPPPPSDLPWIETAPGILPALSPGKARRGLKELIWVVSRPKGEACAQ